MHRASWFASFFVIAALLLSACAEPTGRSLTENADEVKAKGGAATAVSCDEGKEPWRSPGPPIRGGAFVMAAEPPADVINGGVQNYETLLGERKCTIDDRELVPGLVKSWQVTTDGLTWTLKLREGVKWQNLPPVNGRAFTSADVAWMIDSQWKEGRDRAYWPAGVTHSEPDASTIIIKLSKPDPDLAQKFAASTNLLRPREIFEQDGDFKKRAVGTGPFQVKEFRTSLSVTLGRNPDYYVMGADGKSLPYLDEIQRPGFADVTAELAAMRAGQLHHNGTFGFRPDQSKLLQQCCTNLKPYDVLPTIHGSIFFDPRIAPWNDVRVRQAVLKAIDREALIVSYQGGVAHSGYVPAAFTGIAWPEQKLKEKFAYDPEGAKKLLVDSGYNFSGRTFDLITVTQYAQEAEVVQNLLKKVGITAAVKLHPDRSWGPAVMDKNELGWGVAGGAITEFPAYHLCDLHQTGNVSNQTRFSNPDIDRLCAAQGAEIDPAKRVQLWNQIHDKLYELVPTVPTVSTIYYLFIDCKVKNYKKVHLGRNPTGMMQAWLDPKGC